MKISDNGLDLIRAFEGLRLTAYKCPAGVWTIGYGSTGSHVKEGLTITQGWADALLRKDVERFEKGVDELVRVNLAQDEFDALVSFAFNLGLGNLETSTLLRKLNAGDYSAAALEFKKWNRAGEKVLAGLTKRREAESRMFQGLEWR